jgi:hypothetical protein
VSEHPLFGAHRGVGWDPGPHTENGGPAIRAAIRDPGVYYIEADFQGTSDGQNVMVHDESWERTSRNVDAPVNAHTLAWTKAHVRLNDGSVPMSLQQYIDAAKAARQRAYVHMKDGANLIDVAARLKAANAADIIRVTGQNAGRLGAFHALDPHYRLEYVVPGSATPLVATARSLAKRVMLFGDDPYPAAHVRAYLNGGLELELVTNNAAMDDFAKRFPAARILSSNVVRTKAALGLAA